MARPSACCECASTYQGACALRAARPRRRQDGAQDERFEVGTVRRRLTSLHSVLLDELLQIARLSKRFFGSAFQRPYVADESALTQPRNFDPNRCGPVQVKETLGWGRIRRFRKEIIDLPRRQRRGGCTFWDCPRVPERDTARPPLSTLYPSRPEIPFFRDYAADH